MIPPANRPTHESGSAIIYVLLILTILTIIGIAATSTTVMELEVATNDDVHKRVFYGADGGTEVGIELVEQAIDEHGWSDNDMIDFVRVFDGDFYMNTLAAVSTPTSANQSAVYPTMGIPQTGLWIGGDTSLAPGSNPAMLFGYHGIGYGAAGAGAWVNYDIRSDQTNLRNSRAVVGLYWRHLM